MWSTYFNDVKDNILVEAVQDTLGYTVVIPGSMDEQKILQVLELCERSKRLNCVRGFRHSSDSSNLRK